ncbi:MAG TPA: DUF3800 domain-containing protein [Pyrinomonadaceae bacterium]|jgi:hypothetical protein
MNSSQKIYCDEAGFTGSNLLDATQPHFIFASTDIAEDRAQNLLDQAVKKFRIERLRKGNGELKGAELAQHHQGQQALDWLFNKCRKNLYVIINNKQFAVAARFFDITFEPLIASHNTFFFRTNFHRFVSIMIYAGLITGDQLMIDAIKNFHTIFQPRNILDVTALKSSIDRMALDRTSTLQNILHFWQLNEAKVLAEYNRLGDKSDKMHKWLLELSDTGLHISLNFWGTKHKDITPFCDDSKPLSELKPIVGDIIGKFGDGVSFPFTNQAKVRPIEFGKSHENPGLQIADLAASSFNYAANNRGKAFSEKLINDYADCISEHNLLPDLDEISPANEQAVRNYLMLLLLVDKSKNGGLVLTPDLMLLLHHIQSAELPEEFLKIGQDV